MNRKFALTLGLLIVVFLLVGTFAPAFADTEYDILVKNRNTHSITLTFVGLTVRQFELEPGPNTIQMPRGTYTTSYYGCGQLNFQDFTVKPRGNELEIENCNKGGDTTSKPSADEGLFTIINRSNLPLEVSLVGQYNQVFQAPIGKSEHVAKRGTFQLSYYDCGQLNIESITIKKETTYRIGNCTEPKEPTIDPRAKVLFVKNKTFTSFPMYLIGLDNNTDYEITVDWGSNNFYVLPGTYRYSYFACSALHYGNVKVTARGADLKIASCGGNSNGEPETANIGNFRVKNNTNGTLYVQLSGQFNYLFSVTGTGAILTAEKGFYSYTLHGCGRTFTGIVVVGPEDTLIKTPICHSTSQ